jgi:hypothetical protein
MRDDQHDPNNDLEARLKVLREIVNRSIAEGGEVTNAELERR